MIVGLYDLTLNGMKFGQWASFCKWEDSVPISILHSFGKGYSWLDHFPYFCYCFNKIFLLNKKHIYKIK